MPGGVPERRELQRDSRVDLHRALSRLLSSTVSAHACEEIHPKLGKELKGAKGILPGDGGGEVSDNGKNNLFHPERKKSTSQDLGWNNNTVSVVEQNQL